MNYPPKSLRGSNVKAIYDCTFYMENDFDVPLGHWLRGRPSHYSVVVTRIELNKVPCGPDESKEFLTSLFKEKDELLENMKKNNNRQVDSYCLEGSRFYNNTMRRRPFSKGTGFESRVRHDFFRLVKTLTKDQYWKPLATTLAWFIIIMLPILRICFIYALASLRSEINISQLGVEF